MRKNLGIAIGLLVLGSALTGCKVAAVAGEEALVGGGARAISKELASKAVEGVAAGLTHAVAGSAMEHMIKKHEGEPTAHLAGLQPAFPSLRLDSGVRTDATSLPAPKSDDLVIAEIKMAIRAAGNAETMAQRSLDSRGLSEYFAGEALKEEISRVDRRRSGASRAASSLVSFQCDGFKVSPDGKRAQVHVVERWSVAQDSGSAIEHDVPQVEFLERIDGNWKITAFMID